MKQDRLF